MTAPTRITSEGAFVLILDPRFATAVAGAVVYDLGAAADAGVLTFAGRSGVVVPQAGDYAAGQISYGGGDAAQAIAAAQSTADAAQADAAQALDEAGVAQGTASDAIGLITALNTSAVGNVSGVAGFTATDALNALAADVATRATSAALTAETNARIAADVLKAPLASPAFTGNPTVPTASPGDADTTAASTAFVAAAIAAIPPPAATAWGTIAGTLSSQADLQAALNLKAPLASPALTGVPTSPTAAPGTGTTQVATTAFVGAAVGVEAAARAAADALLAPLASPALTGNPTAPTPATSDSDTSVATTAMVQAVAALCVKAFNSGGAVSGARAWYGTATTDANGDWSVNLAPAGFTASPVVLVAGELNTTTVTDQVWATVRTRSATAVAGTAIRGVVLAVLGATLRRAAAGATVHVLAVGT